MELVQVHDKQFKPFISAEQISEQVKKLATQINEDYHDSRPLFIVILNGAFMFASDLLKEITIEAEICFIKLASYKGVTSTGQVVTAIGLDVDIVGRQVIVVEDIIDTGKTISHFLPQIKYHHPASLKIAALLHKPDAMISPVKIDYLGFSVPDRFLVGYGLDYDGLGRNIKEIYQLV
ncbi:MAG: hypoxanthine phosphoribosyltransferase [Ginsengibacter sp.]